LEIFQRKFGFLGEKTEKNGKNPAKFGVLRGFWGKIGDFKTGKFWKKWGFCGGNPMSIRKLCGNLKKFYEILSFLLENMNFACKCENITEFYGECLLL